VLTEKIDGLKFKVQQLRARGAGRKADPQLGEIARAAGLDILRVRSGMNWLLAIAVEAVSCFGLFAIAWQQRAHGAERNAPADGAKPWRLVSGEEIIPARPLLQLGATEPRHVLALRDSFADIPPADARKHTKPEEDYANRPAAANNLLRALSSMMTWSSPRGWIGANPCIGVKKLKGGKPYESWSWEAICLFEKEARAALWHGAALALYTGQRYSDVIKMGWSDIREGQIQVEQDKTSKKLWVPMHKALKGV
jgi:hypothetical protein